MLVVIILAFLNKKFLFSIINKIQNKFFIRFLKGVWEINLAIFIYIFNQIIFLIAMNNSLCFNSHKPKIIFTHKTNYFIQINFGFL